MIAFMLRINEADLDSMLEESSLLEGRFYGEEEEEDGEKVEDGSEMIDLDKAWDGVMYLLSPENRYEGPLSKIIFSDKAVDEAQDFGYGPAHYFSVEDVSSLNALISVIKPEDLLENFNADKMNEQGVYPSSWNEDDEEDRDYLIDAFREIQKFYASAVESKQGIVSILS